ncbi:hypothetical protein BP5796_04787 [Coleophoma crateriformis]|uniref:Glycosyltransferase family 8 protein n=1 Tax=Coleophoma crateriformis TaxID=565419 RepID=A0A3D8SAG7_9HELO|nr:hypothetical protein BP5796_04787 [Coleophoma crateriformis]
MAGVRSYSRRIRRALSTPAAQLTIVLLFILLGIRIVLRNNWDAEEIAPPIAAARPTKKVEDPNIDWSRFKYVQYVTTPEYLCNAVMIWSQIEEIGSRANRIMMYPSNWNQDAVNPVDLQPTPIARMLEEAASKYFVQLYPVEVLNRSQSSEATWADSYTKLLAFNLTEFDRVLTLDSDSVVRGNLDELFLLPPAPIAMPYVWWGQPAGWRYSSQLMLITPSAVEFARIESAITSAKDDEYDMDIVNKLYKDQILHIPQNPYDLLSGEFRRATHAQYLGSTSAAWDPEKALSEAKFLHFSDWPVPKPWIRAPQDLLNKYMPRCRKSMAGFGASDCRDREIWLRLYLDFALKRKEVCGKGFELQSKELPPNSIMADGKWFHPDQIGT